MAYLQCIAGLALLAGGADLFVRGASRLARALGMAPLVVGLTVVALGTSAPEFAVVLQAALSGETAIAVGNVVGSNIFNTLFVLGVSALAAPLVAAQRELRTDLLLMVAASAAVLVLGLDSRIGRLEGAVLFLVLAAYIAWKIWRGRRQETAKSISGGDISAVDEAGPGLRLLRRGAVSAGTGIAADADPRPALRLRDAAFLTVGFLLLIPASQWIVSGATTIAATLGVSDLIIGLTVVAAGTSLPEVATSVVATLRGEREIAVGNVVGSNLFNLLGVLGSAGALSAGGIALSAEVVRFDLPVMTFLAFGCLLFFRTGGKISRWEGGMLLAYYAAYTICLLLAAGADAGTGISFVKNGWTALYFVTPLALVALGATAFYTFYGRKRKGTAPDGET